MYCLQIRDEKYNRITFRFDSKEECSKFADTVLSTCTSTKVEIAISKEENEDVEKV